MAGVAARAPPAAAELGFWGVCFAWTLGLAPPRATNCGEWSGGWVGTKRRFGSDGENGERIEGKGRKTGAIFEILR